MDRGTDVRLAVEDLLILPNSGKTAHGARGLSPGIRRTEYTVWFDGYTRAQMICVVFRQKVKSHKTGHSFALTSSDRHQSSLTTTTFSTTL